MSLVSVYLVSTWKTRIVRFNKSGFLFFHLILLTQISEVLHANADKDILFYLLMIIHGPLGYTCLSIGVNYLMFILPLPYG